MAVDRFRPTRSAIYVTAGAIIAAAAGSLVAFDPLVSLSVVGAAVAVLALFHGGGRVVVVSLGGLLVLQGSGGVTAPKLAYFAFIFLSWVIAFGRLTATRYDQTWTAPFRRLILGSFLLMGLIAVSGPVALGNGAQLADWARDATPYAMLAMLPLIGADCARDVSSRVLVAVFTAIGTIAALGFLIDWLGRRGVSDVGVGKFSLSSLALIAAIFSFAIVRTARGPGRLRWFALAVVALTAVLVSGSRSGLVLVTGFLGVTGGSRKLRVPLRAVVAILACLVLLTVVVTPIVASRVSNDPTFLSDRVSLAVSFLEGGGPTDASYAARVVDYDNAEASVRAHPLFGTGPGFLYPYAVPGATPTTFTLDTPLVTPAKFGLIGTGIIVFLLLQIASTVRSSRRLAGPSQVGTALRGFGAIFVFDLPFGGFLEDKGFSLALMLFLALLAAHSRERSAERPRVPAQQESGGTHMPGGISSHVGDPATSWRVGVPAS